MTVVDLGAPLQIGNVHVRNRVVLAPMSGITDVPFRRLAVRFGAGLVVTEMVASRELARATTESLSRLKSVGFNPHVVQLAGCEAHWMAEAARIAADSGADIIDINMGCPAKKVIGGYAGSALMRDPDHALSLIEATVAAVDIPVTVKMRLGWDDQSINAAYIARRAETAGVKLITVHGRTRMQFYEGKADWDAIRLVREATSLPLIANGDVDTPEDAREILRRSGADAVMAGRACQGRPWHAGVLAGIGTEPEAGMVADIACEHYRMMLDFYGEGAGIRHARKHLGWYLERYAKGMSAEHRQQLMTSSDSREVLSRLEAALRGQIYHDQQKEAA